MASGNEQDPNNIQGPPPNPPDPANPDNQEVTLKTITALLLALVLVLVGILGLLLYSLSNKPASAGGTVDLKPVVQTQEKIVNALTAINENQAALAENLNQLPGKIPAPMDCEAMKKCITPTPTPNGHTHTRRPTPGPVIVTQPGQPSTNNMEVTVTVECSTGNCGQSAPPEHHEHTQNPVPETTPHGHEGPTASEADNSVTVVPWNIRIDH